MSSTKHNIIFSILLAVSTEGEVFQNKLEDVWSCEVQSMLVYIAPEDPKDDIPIQPRVNQSSDINNILRDTEQFSEQFQNQPGQKHKQVPDETHSGHIHIKMEDDDVDTGEEVKFTQNVDVITENQEGNDGEHCFEHANSTAFEAGYDSGKHGECANNDTASELLEAPARSLDSAYQDASRALVKGEQIEEDNNQPSTSTCNSDSTSYSTKDTISAMEQNDISYDVIVRVQKIPYSEGTYHVCKHCDEVFQQRKELERHIVDHSIEKRSHTSKKPYISQECGRSFLSKKLLRYHTKSHTNKSFVCCHCGKNCRKKYALEKHMRIHTMKWTHRCELCDKGFVLKSLLDSHMIVHDRSEFRENHQLNCHMRKAYVDTKFACEHCGRIFNTEGYLRVHLGIHAGIKPYVCQKCGSSFHNKCLLRYHIKSHPEQSVLCCHCGKKCKSKKTFKQHMRLHTMKWSHTCDICKKGFPLKSLLDSHMSVHSRPDCRQYYQKDGIFISEKRSSGVDPARGEMQRAVGAISGKLLEPKT